MSIDYKSLFKVIVSIADIHIGNKAISPEEYKYQIKNGLIEKMKKMNFIDGIVICGDTLHYQISVNSDYANIYAWMASKIVKIAKKHGAFVRWIEGTKSHDLDQLDLIRHYEEDEEVDFKIIDSQYIEVIDGHRYGYIPEEYIDRPVNEYYSDFFNVPDGYFDMIFGHGLVKECRYMEQVSENQSTKAPVFDTDELIRICRGPISFGHIHTAMNIKNRFFYISSLLRTCHGEEEDKGWNIITYIQENGKYRVDKIVNEFTFNFNTLKIDNLFIYKNDIDNIITHIENFRSKNKVDKLSLKITCVDDKETSVKIQLLKKYFAKDKNITTEFKMMSQKAYDKELELELNKQTKPYLKQGLSIVEQIKIWALEERNFRLDDADIERFLVPDTLKRKGV